VSRERETTRSRNDPYADRLYADNVDWAIVDTVERIAQTRGVSMAEVGLAWLMAKPGVTAPIVGATKMEQLDAAIRAVDLALTPEEMAALEAPYTPKRVAF
jgi:aryl-alcohol dehydrogenase-like predicted oxidoreductase